MPPASSSGSEPSGEVLLGLLEEPSGSLHRAGFPSKVGGRPAWLIPEDLPAEESLACESCGKRMKYLMQIYAARDECEDAFHRTLFVFYCGHGCSERLMVLRSQLPRENAYYAFKPKKPPRVADILDGCCKQCGLPGEHEGCDADALLKEWELSIECDEDDGSSDGGSEDEITEEERKHALEMLRKHREEVGADAEVELDKSEQDVFQEIQDKKSDEFSDAFHKAVKREPQQVMRYGYNTDPLWFAADGRAKAIPHCACGAPRVFEFQLMPQMIGLMGLSLDFGTAAVYTCSAHCTRANYVREHVHVQAEPKVKNGQWL